jgi:hypothetical protein
MRAPMRPVWQDRGAAGDAGEATAAHDSNSVGTRQVLDADGHRLPDRRGLLIPDAPTLAQPRWYAMAVDRWLEVTP